MFFFRVQKFYIQGINILVGFLKNPVIYVYLVRLYLELAEPLALEEGRVDDGHLGGAVHIVGRDQVLGTGSPVKHGRVVLVHCKK